MMTEHDIELIDFRVLDLNCHVHPGVGEELQLSSKSSVSARTAEPFDGTLYLNLRMRISGASEELFLMDISSETIMKLPEGKTEVTEDDAPACIAVAQKELYRAIKEISTSMGINPLDLAAE